MIKIRQDVFTPPPIAMSIPKLSLCLFILLVFIGTGWAREIFVDQDSDAIDPDGSELSPFRLVTDAFECAVTDPTVDIITILPGTYCENLTLINFSRNLTIRSTYNSQQNNEEVILNTIIQGGEEVFDSVFYLNNCTGVIGFWGLSIRNGKGHLIEDTVNPDNWTQGGGICAKGELNLEQHVNIAWCNICDNYACWGGGIYGEYASFSINNTKIHDNALYFRGNILPPDSHGGDDYNGSKGGGVYLAGGWSTISQCKIYANRSYLDENHDLYNPLCYGNSAAVVWRNICDTNNVGMIMEFCEVYENVTKTLNDQMRTFDWPFRAIIQIQRGVHVPNPGEGYNHVEINNCTVTDNRIISQSPGTFDLYVNTAVGIIRLFDENHISGTINNDIIYDNTAGGSLVSQEVSLVHQLYGGAYEPDENNNVVFIVRRIPINYCCVSDAHNTDLYQDESGGCIDMYPIFEDPEAYDYDLKWDISAISPCIDTGDPGILDELDDTPSDMGAKTYPLAHDFESYTMPILTNVKWMCYPVLNNITEGSCVNETFFSPMINPNFLDYVMYKPFQQLNIHQMRYIGGELMLGNEIVNSTQGYKVKLQDNYPFTINVPTPGSLIPPETVINLHNMEDYDTNWVGYFVRESAKPLDALASVLDHLTKIETAKWSMVKQADGSWIHGKSFIFNYGDLVILHSDDDCSYIWNNANPVPPFTLGTPTAFNYTEKPSYTPFYISLPEAKDGDLPSEIGLYVNDVCKGAVVVEDSLLHICAYLDNGEVITPENSYLVFYYPAKSAPHSKSIYRMSDKQFQQIKSPSTYYWVSITDPQNYSSVSPIITMNQNYPNPFNPSTTISYELPEDGEVQIIIYNLKGQIVKHLLNKQGSIGSHSIIWDGKDSTGRVCSSGIYCYRLSSHGKTIIKKMLMLK